MCSGPSPLVRMLTSFMDMEMVKETPLAHLSGGELHRVTVEVASCSTLN